MRRRWLRTDPTNSNLDTARIQTALNTCPSGMVVKLVSSDSSDAFLVGSLTLPSGVSSACRALITAAAGSSGSGIYGPGTIDGRGSSELTGGPQAGAVQRLTPSLAQTTQGAGCVIRCQLKGPKDVGPFGALARESIVSFNHSSGNVLPWTTTR
jgi:hypothetical protein